jgi:hypothetical protein
MDPLQYLATYLDDHRAGATGGTRLARRIWRSNRNTTWGPQLEELAGAIERDQTVLEQVREAAGISGGDLKQFGALVVEQVARLKPNRHILTYSPLSRVLELESLMSGVQAKQRLWAVLRLAVPLQPEWSQFDFEALERQGHTQLDRLGQIHEWAVAEMMNSD